MREIEDALSFEVSGDFCARVRQQVATETRRPRGLHRWLAIAATVAAVAGAGVIASLRHLDVEVAPVSRPRAVAVSRESALPSGEAAGVIETAQPAGAIFDGSVDRVSAGDLKSFEAVVPDDQLQALDRLLAAMREGRATVPAQVSDVVVNERGERVLRALALEPLTIEPLAGTPAEPNKNPGRDPNK
jgi:hypothetical protein